MKFYAVAMWRGRGVVPSRLRLLFLGDGGSSTTPPTSTSWPGSKTLSALWQGIRLPATNSEFPPTLGGCATLQPQIAVPSLGGTPPRIRNAAAGQSAGRIAQSIDEVAGGARAARMP